MKKFLAKLFLVLVMFSSSIGILMKPQPAEAQWEILWDNTLAIWDTIKQEVFPVITDTVKIFVIKYAYQDILDWVSGAKDKPAFITDFDEWLFQSADFAVSKWLEEMYGDWFTLLCTGIGAELALYWKKDFEGRYTLPKCTLSEIAGRLEDPSTVWADFAIKYEDANSDTSYLFTVWENAELKRADLEKQSAIEAITGEGFVVKKGDKIKTPGAVVSEYVSDSISAIFDVQTDSDSWISVVEPLINAATIRLMREGINQFNDVSGLNVSVE